MALNASIFGNMLAQPKSPEEYLAERQQLEQGKMANMLNQQNIESYKRDQERQNNLLLMQKRGATADELASAGYYDEASKAYNFSSAKEADQREKAKFTLGVQRDLARRVMAAPSGQSAMAAIDEMERITGQNMDSERQKVAMFQSPDDYRRWAAGHAMTAEQLLPTFGTLNTGGAILDRTVDPVTGKVTVLGSTKVTPTPGQSIQEGNNIRSNARMLQNGAGAAAPASATPAPAPKPAKPLPAAALKMQQESLDAISTSAGINADLGRILGQIQSGALKLGPVANAVSAGKNFAGMSDTQSQNYASFKASLEKLRNDSLRLNKGVQTDGDAQRAWNELLQNINDPGVVQQRLREIQALNERAIGLHQLNIDTIRNNYGAGPLDTSDRVNQKPAIGAGQPAPKAKPSVSNW